MSQFRQFISKNPANNQLLSTFKFFSNSEVQQKIANSDEAFQRFKYQKVQEKANKLNKLADLIESKVEDYAKLITTEMGKPKLQAIGEVKKSAAYCRYYADNSGKFLKHERVPTEAKSSFVSLEPLGPIYVISPFNFPFWLAFKPIIPQVLLGNTILHRPSDSTPLVGQAIEELYIKAGFDPHQFQNMFSSPEQLDLILGDSRVHGVSFTGSTNAGRAIATCAGKYLKRSIMELGGMDPFLVLKEADVNLAVDLAIGSRLTNCGQVCFSAKRFIVHELHYERFRYLLVERLQGMIELFTKDPSSVSLIQPLARIDILERLQLQIEKAVARGDKITLGGKPFFSNPNSGNYYQPTVLEVESNSETLKEEIFGPVFSLIAVESDEDAIKVANSSNYGLGAVVVTKNEQKITEIVKKINCGMVFVNEVVKSDQRLPSGGIKDSGFGRECSRWGIENFANIKTVWIK